MKFFDFLPRKFFIDDLCLFGDLNRQNYAIEKAVFDVFRKLKIQTLILDLAAMQTGSLSEEAEESLDSNGETLYAFLSNLDNDYNDLFAVSEVEAAEVQHHHRPQAG